MTFNNDKIQGVTAWPGGWEKEIKELTGQSFIWIVNPDAEAAQEWCAAMLGIFQFHFSTHSTPECWHIWTQQVPMSPSFQLCLPNRESQEEVRIIRSRYLFLQLPPCKVTSCWLCPFNQNHHFSQGSFLNSTFALKVEVTTSSILSGLQMLTTRLQGTTAAL